MINYSLRYKKWLDNTDLEDALKNELNKIQGNEYEIKERFGEDLEFGTAGLRGIMGAGTNRMNIYTIRKATQGLANYINFIFNKTNFKSVVIAYDSRNNSRVFAEETAKVLANNNIKAYLFQEITATPILSFAVRYLKCSAGIVITASHNPKEYNGFKVYWSDGGQITDRIANSILAEINKIMDEFSVLAADFNEAMEQSLISYVSEKLLEDYLERVEGLSLQAEIISEWGKKLKIVYTPLHGTGNIPVCRVLKNCGFSNILVVPEQEQPDGNFSTVKYPNPEEKEALTLAIELAAKVQGDLVIATDPDADRLGVAVKDNNEDYVLLNGNQLGALLLDYILMAKSSKKLLKGNEVLIKTIVTSELGKAIAAKYGVKTIDVLTGFKYIGEKIKEFNEIGEECFVFGYEESNGYLIGDFVRDKDAVQTALITAEMAVYYKSLGKTVYQRLKELYVEYGYYKERVISYKYEGLKGQEKISEIMNYFRKNTPARIKEGKVLSVKDYYLRIEKNLFEEKERMINLPKSNVIHITLEDKTWIAIRPSGTEPKLKIYFGSVAKDERCSIQKLDSLNEFIDEEINKLNN